MPRPNPPVQLPPLIFGATSLGNLFRQVSDAEKTAIVDAWLATNLEPIVVDSAGKYGAGLSLEVIGRELTRAKADAKRVLVSNKLGWRRVPLEGAEPTFEPDAWIGIEHDAVQDISYDGILRCWEEGNQLLGGVTAQLVSVHDPDEYLSAAADAEDRQGRMQDIVGAYQALTELRDAGKVHATGIGAKDWRTIAELDRHCSFDWVMFANSFTIMRHPPELVEFIGDLAARDVAVVNSALFHGGFLLGGEFFDYRKVDDSSAADQRLLDWRSRFDAICRSYGCSPFDVGVAFGRSHPGVTSIALSSSRADRVASHLRALDFDPPVELWQQLKAEALVDADYPYL